VTLDSNIYEFKEEEFEDFEEVQGEISNQGKPPS
jgi:hypothetical protein